MVIFSIDILVQLVTEHHYTPVEEISDIPSANETEKELKKRLKSMYIERNLKKIAKIRIHQLTFWSDLITVLPLFQIFRGSTAKAQYFYLVKSLRLLKGIKVFSWAGLHQLMKSIMNYFLKKKIKTQGEQFEAKDVKREKKERYRGGSDSSLSDGYLPLTTTVYYDKMTVVYVVYLVVCLGFFSISLCYFLSVAIVIKD